MTVTVDESGRVLIPKGVWERLGVEPGAALSLDVREGGDGAPTLELRKGAEDMSGLEYRDGLLVYTGPVDPAAHDIVEFIREQREARSRRIAGVDPPGRDEP